MKKLVSLVFVLVTIACFFAGCETSKPSEEVKQPAEEVTEEVVEVTKNAEDYKIVLLLPGDVNDHGWNTLNYAGVVACNEQLGTGIEYVESVPEIDFEAKFTEYARRGYDLVIAAGAQFDEAAAVVAENYPDTSFMVIGGTKCNLDNLCPLFPKKYEASYLAAVIAGHITETGKFAMIGGKSNQTMEDLMAVYGKTAVSVAEANGLHAEYSLSYADSWTDIALGKQMAERMIAEGADVIFADANELGLGAINAAIEKGAKVVGYSSDQTRLDPQTVIASINFDYATMYVWAIEKYISGDLEGKQIHEVGVQENIFIPVYTEYCPQEAVDACNAAVEALRNGEVDLKALFDEE